MCYLKARSVKHSNRSLISSGLAARLPDLHIVIRLGGELDRPSRGLGLVYKNSNILKTISTKKRTLSIVNYFH
jgi:hypothetical protein